MKTLKPILYIGGGVMLALYFDFNSLISDVTSLVGGVL